MSLHITFWGTRGSVPTPGAQTVRYGGNTPCVEVRTGGGGLVILDAGTGIRELGRSLMTRARGDAIVGDIFLTHAHWDHIQGLPFFAPIFQRGNRVTLWSSRALDQSADRLVREQMQRGVFPVAFDDVGADVTFRHLGSDSLEGAGYRLTAFPVRHPGGALGFRVTNGNSTGNALVYISDNELDPAAGYDTPPRWRETLVEFARGARVLIHDSMYTVEEYAEHRGWGHSHYRDAVELALDAGAQTLVLFHHRPERSDEEVDQRTAECRALVRARGGKLEVIAAAEGMALRI
ncbi:MAG: MBL fold metallo-hydrolase [Gemmatimonadaceae bacterium]